MEMARDEITPKEKQELKSTEQTRPGRYYVPDVDIYEDESGLRLWADMPGVDQKNVQVEIDEDVLTLQGEVSLESYEGLKPVYSEYNVGHYLRRFNLPAGAFDHDRIKARMVHGVLEIELPKSEKAKPRRIAIGTS